jgi:hypothetical protein
MATKLSARKAKATIPDVDAIKAGIDIDYDKYADMREPDGRIKLTRSKSSLAIRDNLYNETIRSEEAKLASLRNRLDAVKANKPVSDEDEYIADKPFSSLSKKAKKKLSKKELKALKKEEKKKNKKESFEDTLLGAVPGDLSDFIVGYRGGKKGKHGKKDDEEELLAGLTKKHKRTYAPKSDEPKKEKEAPSEVAETFKEVEKITKDNIKEIDATIKIVDAQIKDLTSSSNRVRGRDTAISNYIQAKCTLINARQSAAKDILGTRSKIYDIEMKKSKAGSDENSSHIELLAKVFPSIVGNKDLAKSINADIHSSGKNKDSKDKKNKGNKGRDKDLDSRLMRREKQLIDDGELEYNVYDSNIELEGTFDVAIIKGWNSGDWKFIATDKRGAFMPDVPKKLLPKKSHVSLSFDDEKDTARDNNTGHIYRVYQSPEI